MTISKLVESLTAKLSPAASVLTDPASDEFKAALERWTELDLETPGAVVLVSSEEDIVQTVKLAIEHGIPFVPKSGGHSQWSTIGSEGIIIDLSNYKNVIVNKSAQTVQIQGGVVNREVIEALYVEGLCTSLGGGNTIGTIPQGIGGGICALTKLCGTTSDNILSARMVTAAGSIITVDDSTPDLLWALKGAGQFFGLVTELTLRTYPLSILGMDDGSVYTGTFIFDIPQVGEVTKLAHQFMNVKDHNSAVLAVVTLNPQLQKPCFLLMCIYFGPAIEAEKFLEPFKALSPMMAVGSMVDYTNINDSMDPFTVKGDYKCFNLAGVPRFDPAPWQGIAESFVELTKAFPDIKMGGYGFEWTTGKQKEIELDSVWAHRDLQFWVENLSWYTDESSGEGVQKAAEETLAKATRHCKAEEIHHYQNFSRHDSLESRFGEEIVEKLRRLKKKWDPKGVFTKQLL
ncbi:Glucooligosaccharide oxidase [Hyaloscypha bicolor E]|uniref:Glucooligosaccharide oxidase n=1 Tax=Hyaloscypha bicolor E TaxID=1095630 RepID=A0A2J6T252_9HELO|nr:Glucooligosaccharide oxidase [Hyaloscypha bicolor E]PMD57104.1 Glucooligosaccharide oxidase [Hyaloscypha bicolor E]